MWMKIKDLSIQLSISTRAVQKRISLLEIPTRKINGKTLEVDISKLPEDWMKLLPEEIRKEAGMLTKIASSNSLVLSNNASSALGRTLTAKEKLKLEIVNHYRTLNPLMPESQRAAITAQIFSVSISSVRRYVKDYKNYGVLGRPKKDQEGSWDPEAISYLQGFYLSFMRTTNIQQKKPAWDAVQKEAKEKGWRIGCRSSAYALLDEIPELMKKYAVAGNRALDNFFYIKRDWENLNPSQIWIGDQHIFDWWVVDQDDPDHPYRPVVYLWEDGATRMVAGLAFGHGSYDSDTVIESIRIGIKRMGFFENTYNDNGTAECSKATTQLIDDLVILSNGHSMMRDISDLYKTEDGKYVVEDPETGEPAAMAECPEGWRKMHRRIYANVKNAKAKPIERLFDTLETKLAAKGIPGHVVNPTCPADQEEKEQANLDRWKKNGELLTMYEFAYTFLSVIDEYENTYHSTLKMTPRQMLEKKIKEGWVALRPESEAELDFIFLQRGRAKVRNGRVTINSIDYRGENLKTRIGNYVDVGIALHEGEVIDVRYDKMNPEVAYAVFPSSSNKIRKLSPVKAISLLDDESMIKEIAWKRSQMKVVRELFSNMTRPTGNLIKSDIALQLETAEKAMLEEPENVEKPQIYRPVVHRTRLFKSDYEHYEYCLSLLLEGEELSEEDKAFIAEYETRPEYEDEWPRWKTYKRYIEGETK